MTNSFKVWLVGLLVIFGFAVALWVFGLVLIPSNTITLWEAWSLVLTVVTISSGYQEYYKKDSETD